MLVFSQTPEETNIGFKTLHGNITLGAKWLSGGKKHHIPVKGVS